MMSPRKRCCSTIDDRKLAASATTTIPGVVFLAVAGFPKPNINAFPASTMELADR